MKSNASKKFIVAAETSSQRLDLFLSNELAITRSQAQKMIEQGRVFVNGKQPKKMGEQVKTGDEIEISKTLEVGKISKQNPKLEIQKENPSFSIAPTIIAEAADYIVVEKPTGMLTHPTMANEQDTLVNWLVKKYPEIKKVGDDPTVRPGIVHRLDKEASGLLVVARTQKMFEHLKEQFKNRTIEKEYYALAHGKVAKDWDIITFPIARGKTHDRMAARPLRSVIPTDRAQLAGEGAEESLDLSATQRSSDSSTALHFARNDIEETIAEEKEAKTEFLVEKRFANCTLLRITLHTGRMHQIRVHLLAYNHPLVGDPLYFQKKRKRNLDEKLGRLFLHSTTLSFADLDGERQTFESPLPKKLQDFLTNLK